MAFIIRFRVIDGVVFPDSQRLGIALLIANGDMFIQLFKLVQGKFFKFFLELLSTDVSVSHENGVAGMVMGFIEIQQGSIAQIRNITGVTAAVIVVGCRWKKMFAQELPHQTAWRTHGSFHFVIDNTFIFQR